MKSKYFTLKESANDEFIVQKSRFIGYASPCQNEEEAKAFIAQIKSKHKDATHNCSAYIIGENAEIMRYSDDGEPSGTAGIPMLEMLKQMQLVNCVVVVTRYFGGILLGAGGLIRAYRKGANIAVKASQVVCMESTFTCIVKIDYALWARLEKKLETLPLLLSHIEYSDCVRLELHIKQEDLEATKQSILDFTEGKADISHGPAFYYPWPSESEFNDEEL
ncbi:MAG: YigZ family protein [Eubacteriales bacterium]|nr:YigZ family protein [Eubacteriales bacterium]